MIRPALYLLAFLVCLPLAGAAQEGVSLRIDGFEGFAWGTVDTAVIARFGAPVQADTLEQGVVVLAFPAEIIDTASIALFAFLPGQGLVKGQHSISFAPSDDCVGLFQALRRYLLLKYPMIVPEDRSRNDSNKSFCDSVVDGDAAWIASWADAETGAQALVSIEAGRPRVDVVFESAAFLSWIEGL